MRIPLTLMRPVGEERPDEFPIRAGVKFRRLSENVLVHPDGAERPLLAADVEQKPDRRVWCVSLDSCKRNSSCQQATDHAPCGK